MRHRYRNRTLLFQVTDHGLVLKELAPGFTIEDIRACTEADFTAADHIDIME